MINQSITTASHFLQRKLSHELLPSSLRLSLFRYGECKGAGGPLLYALKMMMMTTIDWEDGVVEVCMYVCVVLSRSWFLVDQGELAPKRDGWML